MQRYCSIRIGDRRPLAVEGAVVVTVGLTEENTCLCFYLYMLHILFVCLIRYSKSPPLRILHVTDVVLGTRKSAVKISLASEIKKHNGNIHTSILLSISTRHDFSWHTSCTFIKETQFKNELLYQYILNSVSINAVTIFIIFMNRKPRCLNTNTQYSYKWERENGKCKSNKNNQMWPWFLIHT